MPVTYSIDVARRIIRTACHRPITIADVISHFQELKNDPDCSGTLDVLLDVSDADSLPESGQFAAVTGQIRNLREKVQFGTLAVVAPGDTMFGMMRMFEVVAGQLFRATRVFRDPAEAEAWLTTGQSAGSSGQSIPPFL